MKISKKENFYHGILLGLFSHMDDWIVRSNAESGDGYSDILIEIPMEKIGIIIEVKYGEDKNMEHGCDDALKQIEEKNHIETLEDDDISADYIVTRNIKDFEYSTVPAILPDDFLKLL